MREEDPINPKMAPIIAWLSGAFLLLGLARPEIYWLTTIFSGVFGILAYLAYRWRFVDNQERGKPK